MPDHKIYTAVANELLSDPRMTEGNLFGVPVLKIGGKPFAGLYQKDLVVKLGIDRVQEMLKAKTGMPFDPSGRNHPMKEWIRIKEPATQAKKKWLTLAAEARDFVEQKQR
jgi:TfoX/Sxy family transcriptional regulator of competence genes